MEANFLEHLVPDVAKSFGFPEEAQILQDWKRASS